MTDKSISAHRDIHELLNQKLRNNTSGEEGHRLHSYPSKYSIGLGSNQSAESISGRIKGEIIKINE